MYKSTILRIFVVFVVFMVSSCSNDDENPAPTPLGNYIEENPYYGFLATVIPSATVQEFLWEPALSQEIGIAFTPTVNGMLTSIETKLPFVNNNLSVHIWNYATHELLRTETINVGLGGTIIKKNIEGINLQANTKYVISMTTHTWYRYTKNGGASISFPFTAGNVRIDQYVFGNFAGSFPANTTSEYYEGELSFSFLRTN